MFYGLNNFVKNLLPKRLFYRALLIVAVPIIVLQVVITIVFFDSLWIKTNKGMTRALIGEMKTFIAAYDNGKYNNNDLSGLFSIYLDLNVEFKKDDSFEKPQKERWFSPIDRTLRRELKSNIGNKNYWFDTTSYKELIHINIKHNDGYFEFFIPKDRVASSSARVFALWITLPALLMITIAILFLKNQTRPIINLAKAAERFGKGENIDEYRPSGALEIRQAGLEFDKMRKRIMRHLNQRSEMLSGGRRKIAVLGDAMEAVIGAVYLDAGYVVARDMVVRLWANHIDNAAHDARDPKTMLQEWAQAKKLPTPKYIEIGRSGPDHAPIFTIEVSIETGQSARAQAQSKRAVSQEATAGLLGQLES